MIHPLTGADAMTIARLIARNGGPSRAAWPAVAGALGSALGRAPMSAVERGYVAMRRPHRDMPPPIFILGHWRSGTTHLFNLLAGAPSLAHAAPISAGLPWDFLVLGRLLRPLLERAIPARRGIDPMAVTPESPQEDEIGLASMSVPSYYHGIYMPQAIRREMARGLFFDGCTARERRRWADALRRFTGKVSHAANGRRVLIKNPAHTAKVREIRAIWPTAKFVHIVRNPYHVYQSTVRMFDDLIGMLGLQPADRPAMLAAVHETYPRMMARVRADTADLPSDQMAHARFEDLESDPLGVVRRIAEQLALADRDALLRAAEAHLAEVAAYRSRTRGVSPEVAEAVETHWGDACAWWGYARAGAG